jgi:perosamine synthetase
LRTIPFGFPLIGDAEKDAVAMALNDPILVHGPRSKKFESDFAKYTAADYAVSVSSCTAALHLCWFYKGVGPGDEVIVSAQTHVATAHAIELCGAKPVFVDSEIVSGNIDLDQIESVITERTRGIAIVHYLGMPVNMDILMAISQKHKLFVVEDCALALGTYFRGIHAGLHGDAGCFSFYPVKHMTTAEGGMIITRDKDMADRITRQKAFGVDRHMGERTVPGVYDVTMLGYNYRMNEIQAALGIEQLKRIERFLERRAENYEALHSALSKIEEIGFFKSSHAEYKSSHYCLSILLNDQLKPKRFEIVNHLKQNGVGTSVYYPSAVPHFSYYKGKYGYSDNSFPVAARISSSSIALPVGPHVSRDDVEYMARIVKDAIVKVK